MPQPPASSPAKPIEQPGLVKSNEARGLTDAEKELKEKWANNESKIRHFLNKKYPFLFSVARPILMIPVIDSRVPTACVDGERMFYNPKYLETMRTSTGKPDVGKMMAVFMHEFMHPALAHHYRGELMRREYGDAYDHQIANIAFDIVVQKFLHMGGAIAPDNEKDAARNANNALKGNDAFYLSIDQTWVWGPEIYGEKMWNETACNWSEVQHYRWLIQNQEKLKKDYGMQGDCRPEKDKKSSSENKPQDGQGAGKPSQGKGQSKPSGNKSSQGSSSKESGSSSQSQGDDADSGGHGETPVHDPEFDRHFQDASGKTSADCDRGIGQAAKRIFRSMEEARMRGKLPAGMDDFLSGLFRSETDWREPLREFIVTKHNGNQLNYSKIHRRYASQVFETGTDEDGQPIMSTLCIPATRGEELRLAIGRDTSGSMSSDDVLEGISETVAIIGLYPKWTIDVVDCDSQAYGVRRFNSNDHTTDEVEEQLKHLKGGGGTAFGPMFDELAEHWRNLGEEPMGTIVFTDGMGDNPPRPPMPVLWALVNGITEVSASFGQIIAIKSERRG
jgi:predicted metal-dependent peptidase